jgi:phosphoserine phosphatase RsbU/P
MSFDHPKFFEKAVHFSPSSVVITDLEGNIQYVNPKFEALTGYTLDEVIGKNPRVLNSGYSAPGEYREMWEMLLAGRTWRGMFRNKKKNGELYWESASISPMRDENGVFTHYMAIKEDITKQVESENRLQQAFDVVKTQRNKILHDLNDARATQQMILPNHLPNTNCLQTYAKYIPFEEIGGDFYDVAEISRDRVAFIIADVTGHGVSAALISWLLSSEFRNALLHDQRPVEMLKVINLALLNVVSDGRFVTATVGILNAQTGALDYSVAGHPDFLVYRADTKKVESLTTDGMLLGQFPSEVALFEEKRTILNQHDKLFLYSDAFIEVDNASGEQLGMDGLASILSEHGETDLKHFVEGVFSACQDFNPEHTLSDDATILAFEFGSRDHSGPCVS